MFLTKNKILEITSLFIIFFCLFFLEAFEIKVEKIYAILTLFLSFILLYKNRKNDELKILFFILLYFTYSIIMGEYLLGNLKLNFHGLQKYREYYLIGIKLLYLFVVILYLGIDKNIKKYKLNVYKKNIILFNLIIAAILYIGTFKINRSNSSGYEVKILPMYEYVYLLFGYLGIYSNNEKKNKYIILALAFFIIIQDFIYGGRITSLQIVLVIFLLFYRKKITLRFIFLGSILGILIMNIVNNYRKAYNFSDTLIFDTLKETIKNGFINETAIYAYAASVTHIAASKLYESDFRMQSFFSFLRRIFNGGNWNGAEKALVTRISNQYFTNVGGGILPTHFYFWLGLVGAVCAFIFLTFIIRKIYYQKNQYFYLMMLFIVATSPRWYLYTPLNFFRGPIFFNLILYNLFKGMERILDTKVIK